MRGEVSAADSRYRWLLLLPGRLRSPPFWMDDSVLSFFPLSPLWIFLCSGASLAGFLDGKAGNLILPSLNYTLPGRERENGREESGQEKKQAVRGRGECFAPEI